MSDLQGKVFDKIYRVGRDNLNTRFFMNFAKHFLMPESVPHFKAPINAKMEP